LSAGWTAIRLDVANAYPARSAHLTDNPAILASQTRTQLEWSAAANMQRHLHDCNLEDNKAVLDQIRRRVEASGTKKRAGDVLREAFVFGEFSEEFERSGCYLPPDKGLHAGYNFALLVAKNMGDIRAHLETLAAFPVHWPCIAFSNHDVIRTATRFGPAAAKAMLALLAGLRGTLLLYQGEELGLTEVDLARNQLKDPVGDLYYPLFKGRDGCRTPMPWQAHAPHLGFSTATPWLPLGSQHERLAVSEQEGDPASALNFTRKLLAARKALPALWDGSLDLLPGPGLAFLRHGKNQMLVCAFNLEDSEITLELPGFATSLELGTGAAAVSGSSLRLGPHSAWFGRF
jgi:alpha-glucosidase